MKVTQEGVERILILQSLFEGLMFVVSVYLAFKHVKAAKAVSDITYFHIVHVFATLPQHILLTATFAVFFQHWDRSTALPHLHKKMRPVRSALYGLSAVNTSFWYSFGIATLDRRDGESTCTQDTWTYLMIGALSFSLFVSIDWTWLTFNLLNRRRDERNEGNERESLTPELFRLRLQSKATKAMRSVSRTALRSLSNQRNGLQRGGVELGNIGGRSSSGVSSLSPSDLESGKNTSICTFENQLPNVCAMCAALSWLSMASLLRSAADKNIGRDGYFIFKICCILFGAVVMLAMMWTRRSLQLVRSDVESEWGGSLTFASDSHAALRFSASASARDGDEEDDIQEYFQDDAGRTVASFMVASPELTSSTSEAFFMKAPTSSFARNGELEALNHSAGPVLPLADSSIAVKESLSPAPQTVALAQLHARKVTLPALSKLSEHARLEVALLLKGAKPKKARPGPEEARLFEELGQRGRALVAKYEGFLRSLDGVVRSSAHGEPALFKTSKTKSMLALAPLATNCQVHLTRFCREASGSGGSGAAAAALTDLNNLAATSITFGAPSAHCFKFKHGGLDTVAGKVAGWHKRGLSDAASTRAPAQVMDFLHLKFEAAAREAVVVSQALGGAIGAAGEQLRRCVEARDEEALRLWSEHRAGMLVHAVCLLSTQGKEEGMIDDFAGGWGRLDVNLSFAPPPAVAAAAAAKSVSMAAAERAPWSELPSVVVVNLVAKEARTAEDPGGRRTAGESFEASPAATLFPSPLEEGSLAFGRVDVELRVSPPMAHAWVVSILRPMAPATETVGAARPCAISLVPVLFNLGVNEMQTVANAKGSTKLQTTINRKGLAVLEAYYARHKACLKSWLVPPLPKEVPSLLVQLEKLVEDEARERKKFVDLLLVSCYAARLLRGARTTSCKSAKDRTSVFHTLEMARLAMRAGLLAAPSNSQAAMMATTTIAVTMAIMMPGSCPARQSLPFQRRSKRVPRHQVRRSRRFCPHRQPRHCQHPARCWRGRRSGRSGAVRNSWLTRCVARVACGSRTAS